MNEFLLNRMPDQQEHGCHGCLLFQAGRLLSCCHGFDRQTKEMKPDYPVRQQSHGFLYSFHRDLCQ